MCLRIHFKIYAQSLLYNTVFFFFFFSFFKKYFFKKFYDKKKTDFFTVFIFHENDIKNSLNDQMFKIFSNDLLTNVINKCRKRSVNMIFLVKCRSHTLSDKSASTLRFKGSNKTETKIIIRKQIAQLLTHFFEM